MANIFEKNKTYLGDCLKLMPQMEIGIFDMILCDLPYGTTACKWDTIIPFEPLWKEYERLIKPNGAIVLTASQPFTSALVMSNPKLFRYEWIWNKVQTTNSLNAKRQPLRQHESVLVFFKKQSTYNRQFTDRPIGNQRPNRKNHKTKVYETTYGKFTRGIGADDYDNTKINPKSIITINNGNAWTRIGNHPTQKPVELFEYLIKTYTNEGELILDNCAGSGTTGEACYNTGRNYIQIEKEQDYFSLILEREKSFNKKDLYDGTLFETRM